MTEAFWWYVLAGFLLGFGVSTLWEWLYFRRQRMTIRNQRIAELEATVRTYAAATGAPPSRVAEEGWAEPIFENPGVYLETEESAPPAAPPDTLPPNAPQPAENVPPPRPAPFVSASANGAPAPARQPTTSTPTPYADYAGSTAPVGGFQSVAVQQPPATGSIASATVANSASSPAAETGLPSAAQPAAAQPAPSAEALAALSVVTVAHRMHEEFREDAGESAGESVHDDAGDENADLTSAATGERAPVAVADAAPDAGADRASQPVTGAADPANSSPPPATTVVVERPPQTAYVNGRVEKPDAAGESSLPAGETNYPAGSAAESKEIRIITSSEIGTIRSEINSLLDGVNHTTGASDPTPIAEAASHETTADDPYTTRISGRTEYVLVRLVQSLVYFARQVRGILTGTDAARPALHTAPGAAGDDLTRIAGLNADHAARLHTAGVTSYARLAQLSPDELRQIAFTPGGAAVDPVGWRQAAAQLARREGALP